MGEAMPAMDRLAECGPVHGQLGALLLVQETLHELLQLVVTSIGSYRETYGASVTARRGDSFYTPNASSGRVRDLDTTQYETNDGPSVSATMTGTEVNLGLEEVRSTWEALGEVMERRDLGGLMASPLFTRRRTLGTLNVYMDTAGPAEEPLVGLVRGFAQQASALLGRAFDLESCEPLDEALGSRDIVGQAMGILMAQSPCSAEDALQTLTLASRRANRQLTEVADQIVEATSRRPTGGRGAGASGTRRPEGSEAGLRSAGASTLSRRCGQA